ncbi:hypothetical protein BKA67DRAFT_660184 [Truncatella angustata]|uniref:Uncharacterized protein n=1 Tax=Truncatella angustata TaxID=152316 RepID=A0A9P8UK19_9PEZI|nr:uncharacterized protein BKA67DRAFT_660184 [Truncatella angustata]KAH6653606.1 hypothetical protein BKA67DRAFT_660184 [Truncatella angustata]
MIPSEWLFVGTLTAHPAKRFLDRYLGVILPTSVAQAFLDAAAHFGDEFRIDALVNNAGYGLAGDTEAASEEEMHHQLETNFFGTSGRGGIVFNISSLGGVAAFPGQSFYHASKFAVECWSESFARELHPDWNINICIVEPGSVETNFEHGSKKRTEIHEAYDGPDMPARRLAAWVEKGVAAGAGAPPLAVAEVVYLVASRNGKVPLWLPRLSQALYQ